MISTTNLLKKFNADLLLTDTDSLTLTEIKSKDVYEELVKHNHLFDFSEHRPEFFEKTKKNVSGKMKDEFKGVPINKFIGLKWKMIVLLLMMIQKLTKQKK